MTRYQWGLSRDSLEPKGYGFSPRISKSSRKYPHLFCYIRWRGMENHHPVCQSPRQQNQVHWSVCCQLWFHWRLYWHSEWRWWLCYDPANETFQFPCTKSWWNLLCTSASFWPVLLCCQGAPHGRSPFHTSPLPAHLAAAYHNPISFFKTASAAPLWNSKILARKWWNNESSSIPPMEIWRYNSLAAQTRTTFSAQLHQSWDWRHCIQWTQTECAWWFYSFCPAPRAVCVLHWQPGIQWATTWTINLMPMSRRQSGIACRCPVG